MDEKQSRADALKKLPSVDELLRLPAARQACATMPRPFVVDAIRSLTDDVRRQLLSGADASTTVDWEQRLKAALSGRARRQLMPVINATGVVLHTNLGRAPLSAAAIDAMAAVSRGYSNLEYDLETGQRGQRGGACEAMITLLTGAESALVVNNNAAAVLLVLTALAKGREVIVSRGELIEIGGSFRIPDVLAQSGCRLIEVGTTNRTYLADYTDHVGEETAALLKVHTSNYRVVGFTRSVGSRDLARLATEKDILFIEDMGSGVFIDTTAYGLMPEPTAQEAIASGADVLTFSGDKLLGGPQAGIIAGRRQLIDQCRRHPLARAVRADKTVLAALQATLHHYVENRHTSLPLWRMIHTEAEAVKKRVEALCHAVVTQLDPLGDGVPTAAITPAKTESTVGGGSLPGETLPSWAIQVKGLSATDLAARLRAADPPVVGRIEGEALYLDLRTVDPQDDSRLTAALVEAVRAVFNPTG